MIKRYIRSLSVDIFFHENEKVEIEFTQEELHLLYVACMSYGDKLSKIKKSNSDEAKRNDDIYGLARKITEYMEDGSNV